MHQQKRSSNQQKRSSNQQKIQIKVKSGHYYKSNQQDGAVQYFSVTNSYKGSDMHLSN